MKKLHTSSLIHLFSCSLPTDLQLRGMPLYLTTTWKDACSQTCAIVPHHAAPAPAAAPA